jgi:amino acid adenylation domain-containing protein
MKKFKGLKGGGGLSAQQYDLITHLLKEEGFELSDSQTISPRGEVDNLPLSSSQERLWFIEQLFPGTPTYHITEAFQLKGTLNVAVLENCLNEVVRRHEALRTNFASKEGHPIQVISPRLALKLPVTDLREVPENERKAHALRLARQEMRRRFDLSKGPLLRAKLLRLGIDEYYFLVVMHHIISDGWSSKVFIREMVALYESLSKGEPSPLPDLPIQYADYSLWEKVWLESGNLQPHLEYWNQQLADLPVLELPADRPRPPIQTFRGAIKLFELPTELSTALNTLCLQQGTTMFMTLIAAYAALLHRWTGQRDIPIGTPVANRNRPHTEELIGFFVNTLVLRVGLAGDPTYKELLSRVRKLTLDAFDHQDLPFDQLVRLLQRKRDMSRAVLRQVLFAMQNMLSEPIQLTGLTLSPLIEEVSLGVARLDLSLFMWEAPDRLMGAVEYNTDLFDESTIERAIGHLRVLLEDMASDPGRRIAALPPPNRARQEGWSSSRSEEITERREPVEVEGESAYQPSNLTQGQLLFWFSHKYQPETRLYFDRVVAAFTINGELDRRHFELAFQKLIRNSDALRTVIIDANGTPQQKVLDDFSFELEYLDFSELPDPYAGYQEWLSRQYRVEIDFEKRLFDSFLIKTAPDQFIWYLSVHHVITDMWSEMLIIRYLSDYYRLSLKGELDSAQPIPAFRGYIDHERKYRSSERYHEDEAYWKRKLSDPPQLNRFYGTEHSTQTTRSKRVPCGIGEERTLRIKQVTREQGFLSPAIIFVTTLFAYMFRMSGDKEQMVGFSFANRTDAFKDVVGLLFNICPIRVTIERSDSLYSLARKLQLEILETARHQNYPVRNPVSNRIYDVNFTYQNASLTDLCGMPTQFDLIYSGHSSYSLALQVRDFDASDQFVLDFDFNYGAFSEQNHQQSIEHFFKLLDSFLQDGGQPLRNIDLLSEKEQRLLSGFNNTAKNFPENVCWPQLFEAQVERTPEAVAAACDREELSYKELNRRANRLGRALADEGVGPEVTVALLAERDISLLTAIIAILKAGGAYLPIDPRYPPRRMLQLIDQSQAHHILITASFRKATDQLLEEIPSSGRPQVFEIEELIGPGEDETNLPPRCSPSNLAYVIYTSGSTGTPKGAMIEHKGMLNHLYAKLTDLGMSRADRVAQTAPQSFDISVWQFLVSLLVGGSVHIFTDEVAHNPDRLLLQAEAEKISILETVPSLLLAMIEHVERLKPDHPDLAELRWIIPTGEALPPETCRRCLGHYPNTPLVNAYGPTECSDDVTHCFIYQPPPADVAHTPIGRAIANTQIYLLDSNLQPAPVGVAGEMFVGGEGVCRGYLNSPERTAEVFVPNPFAQQAGERLYRTGDLARYLPDGSLVFLGRVDHQVKVRGNRIELGEIEAVLAQHPAVRQAVIVAREDEPGNKRLVAYLVADEHAAPAAGDIRKFIRERLPDYMVPSAFMMLDAMPLTPNGKINRNALPAPDQSYEASQENFVEASSPLEKLLAELWGEVLGRDCVGINDNFFEMGGHSIMATQLVYKIQQLLPVEISLRSIFEAPTIAELSKVIALSSNESNDEEQNLLSEMLAELEQMPDETLGA